MFKTAGFFALCAVLCVQAFAGAEEALFDEIGEGTASKYEAPLLAEKRAEEDALRKVLSRSRADVYYGYQDAMAQGKAAHQFIASSMYLFSSGVADYRREGSPEFEKLPEGAVKCRLRLKGKVVFKGKPDPSFEVKLDKDGGLNRPVYFDGDEVKLSFSVTRDAFVHIVALDEKNNAVLLYPNNYIRKHERQKAGLVFAFPGDDSALSVKALLPEGRQETFEILHVIVTKDKPLFSVADAKENSLGAYKQLSLGDMSALSKRLASLDRSQWTMRVFPYEIRKKAE